MPHDEEEVMAFVPVEPAPMTMFIAASSLSTGINTRFASIIALLKYSPISLCGVIG